MGAWDSVTSGKKSKLWLVVIGALIAGYLTLPQLFSTKSEVLAVEQGLQGQIMNLHNSVQDVRLECSAVLSSVVDSLRDIADKSGQSTVRLENIEKRLTVLEEK